jgi:hypothetical protein
VSVVDLEQEWTVPQFETIFSSIVIMTVGAAVQCFPLKAPSTLKRNFAKILVTNVIGNVKLNFCQLRFSFLYPLCSSTFHPNFLLNFLNFP